MNIYESRHDKDVKGDGRKPYLIQPQTARPSLIRELLYKYGGKINSDELPHCDYIFISKGDDLHEDDLVLNVHENAWCEALPAGERPTNNFVVPVIRAVRMSITKITLQMDKEHEDAVSLGMKI